MWDRDFATDWCSGERRFNHDEYCSKTLSWMNWVMWILIFRAHDPELFYERWSRKWHWHHPNHGETMFLNSTRRSSMPDTPRCPSVRKSRRPIEGLFCSRWIKFFSSSFFNERVNQKWESVQQVYTSGKVDETSFFKMFMMDLKFSTVTKIWSSHEKLENFWHDLLTTSSWREI